MEARKFKTSAKCAGCVSAIAEKLNTVMNAGEWSIDLSTPDRVLTVTSEVPDEQVMSLVKEAGFKIEKI